MQVSTAARIVWVARRPVLVAGERGRAAARRRGPRRCVRRAQVEVARIGQCSRPAPVHHHGRGEICADLSMPVLRALIGGPSAGPKTAPYVCRRLGRNAIIAGCDAIEPRLRSDQDPQHDGASTSTIKLGRAATPGDYGRQRQKGASTVSDLLRRGGRRREMKMMMGAVSTARPTRTARRRSTTKRWSSTRS